MQVFDILDSIRPPLLPDYISGRNNLAYYEIYIQPILFDSLSHSLSSIIKKKNHYSISQLSILKISGICRPIVKWKKVTYYVILVRNPRSVFFYFSSLQRAKLSGSLNSDFKTNDLVSRILLNSGFVGRP